MKFDQCVFMKTTHCNWDKLSNTRQNSHIFNLSGINFSESLQFSKQISYDIFFYFTITKDIVSQRILTRFISDLVQTLKTDHGTRVFLQKIF